MDVAIDELGRITGQRPVVTQGEEVDRELQAAPEHADRRRGDACAARECLNFWIGLTSVVLPRVRDFRGVSTQSFDGRGNYTLGLRDQLIFPEISYEKVDKIRGMNVTIVTTAQNGR